MFLSKLTRDNNFVIKHTREDLEDRLRDKVETVKCIMNKQVVRTGDAYVGFDYIYPDRTYANFSQSMRDKLGSLYWDFDGPLLSFSVEDDTLFGDTHGRKWNVYVQCSIAGCEKIQDYPIRDDLPDLFVLDGYRLKGFIINENKVIPLSHIVITWNTYEHRFRLLAIDEVNNNILNIRDVFNELRRRKGWTVFGDTVAECNGYLLYMYEPDFTPFEISDEDRWMRYAAGAYYNSSYYTIYQDGECIYGTDISNNSINSNVMQSKLQEKIDKLKRVVVSRGATEHEELTAKRKIELLTKQMLHAGDTVSEDVKERVKIDIIVPVYRQGLYGHGWHIEYGDIVVGRGNYDITVYEFLQMLDSIVNSGLSLSLGTSNDIRHMSVSAVKCKYLEREPEFGMLYYSEHKRAFYMFNRKYKGKRGYKCYLNKLRDNYKSFSSKVEDISWDNFKGSFKPVELYKHTITFVELPTFIKDNRRLVATTKHHESSRMMPNVGEAVVLIPDDSIVEKHGSIFWYMGVVDNLLTFKSAQTNVVCYKLTENEWLGYKGKRLAGLVDMYKEYEIQFNGGATLEAVANFDRETLCKSLVKLNGDYDPKERFYSGKANSDYSAGSFIYLPRYAYTEKGEIIPFESTVYITKNHGGGYLDIEADGLVVKNLYIKRAIPGAYDVEQREPVKQYDDRHDAMMKHIMEKMSGLPDIRDYFD